MKKRCLFGLGLVVVFAIILGCFNNSVRVEFHKWRLKDARADRERLLLYTPELSWWEKAQKNIMGWMVTLEQLDRRVQRHENALVRLGFLQREQFPSMSGKEAELDAVILALKKECPWFHAERIGGTNVVVTACADGIKKWRDRMNALNLDR